MFFGVWYWFSSKLETFWLKGKCLSMPFNKYTTHVMWLFSLIFTKNQLLVEWQRPNVMRLISWHFTQNVMRFALWDGKPMAWLYCHEIWRMSWDLSLVGWWPGLLNFISTIYRLQILSIYIIYICILYLYLSYIFLYIHRYTMVSEHVNCFIL